MNVWLNLHADRCVLWQRNADRSRCRAAPTPLARTGGKGAIRGVRGLGLGLGAAWHQPEHEELGIPFPPLRERAERLEEGVQVVRLLMTKGRATFKGRQYRLAGASYHPKPIQRPHPPIWIGASGEQLMLPI